MSKLSVLIPDGESDFALFVMHGFIDIPDVKLYVLSNNRWAPARFSRHCHKFLYKQIGTDYQERLEAIAQIVQETGVDVLLPVETDWIEFAGAMRQSLSQLLAVAPVPEPETYKIVNNKWLLALFMQAHQVPGPPTVLGTLDDDFEQQLLAMEFPVLIKPVTAWGGEGIRRFENVSQLQSFLEEYGRERFRNRYIVQSFLPGYVIGLNVLCQDGRVLAYTMQRGTIPNPQKWAAAAAIRFIEQEGVLETAQRLVTALNWSGFGNIDAFYDTSDRRVKILEFNARFWGSLRGSYVAGVSFPYLACLAALGIPFRVPEYKPAQYFHPKTAIKEGILKFLGKSRHDFALSETGLKFLLSDPLAETIRAFQQELTQPHHSF
ncbi:MAG: ATP-grasp domain-containing protein [Anaerolineae bacterium]|nr:ATP-grasp domain-containing protein [Anaerolineae bacterium]